MILQKLEERERVKDKISTAIAINVRFLQKNCILNSTAPKDSKIT